MLSASDETKASMYGYAAACSTEKCVKIEVMVRTGRTLAAVGATISGLGHGATGVETMSCGHNIQRMYHAHAKSTMDLLSGLEANDQVGRTVTDTDTTEPESQRHTGRRWHALYVASRRTHLFQAHRLD